MNETAETVQNSFSTQIDSLDHLRELSKDRSIQCYILSTSGRRSNKNIKYSSKDGWFVIHHEIDGEFEILNGKQFSRSFIGTALRHKGLFKYN